MKYLKLGVFGAVMFGAGFFAHEFSLVQDYFAAKQAQQERRIEADKLNSDQEWAAKLKQGGYILHIRHAQRARWRDASVFDYWEAQNRVDAAQTDFADATCLNDQGVQEAKMLGRVFEAATIPVGHIYSSPVCRARQTAENAFGKDFEVRKELVALSAMMPQQRGNHISKLKDFLLSVPIEAEKNTVMTGHGASFATAAAKVFDTVEMRPNQDRHETGLYVIERVNGKIIARHRFTSMRALAHSTLRLND